LRQPAILEVNIIRILRTNVDVALFLFIDPNITPTGLVLVSNPVGLWCVIFST